MNYKAYQLKDVLRQYIEETEKKIVYKSKNEKDVVELIKATNINISDYEIIQHDQTQVSSECIEKIRYKGIQWYWSNALYEKGKQAQKNPFESA